MCHCEDLPCRDFVGEGVVCFFVIYIVLENVTNLKPNVFSEQWVVGGDQASGWACRTRVRNFRVYLSKAACNFELLCVKMSKIDYFLQITWFWCRIQILL